jgi:phage terminase small subunit
MGTWGKATTETDKLSEKEARFCYEYVLHLNGSKAAALAGYAQRSARVTASKLLTKPNIQARIRELKDNLAETAEISALRVLKEYEKIAFSDICDLREGWMDMKKFKELTEEQRACIQEVETKETKFGTEVKIKLYDKQKALDGIGRMLGFAAPTKTEVTGKDGKDLFEELSDDELTARVKELEGKLAIILR